MSRRLGRVESFLCSMGRRVPSVWLIEIHDMPDGGT